MTAPGVPARTAHGWVYWLTIGWLWEPLAWCVRVCLWFAMPPLGIFLSWLKHRRNVEGRLRRGAR